MLFCHLCQVEEINCLSRLPEAPADYLCCPDIFRSEFSDRSKAAPKGCQLEVGPLAVCPSRSYLICASKEAGLAQGIRETFFKHLLLYTICILWPLGKHYQSCGTWSAQSSVTPLFSFLPLLGCPELRPLIGTFTQSRRERESPLGLRARSKRVHSMLASSDLSHHLHKPTHNVSLPAWCNAVVPKP